MSKALGQVEPRDITVDQMGLELTTITIASTKNDLPKNPIPRDATLTKDLDIKGGMEEVNLVVIEAGIDYIHLSL